MQLPVRAGVTFVMHSAYCLPVRLRDSCFAVDYRRPRKGCPARTAGKRPAPGRCVLPRLQCDSSTAPPRGKCSPGRTTANRLANQMVSRAATPSQMTCNCRCNFPQWQHPVGQFRVNNCLGHAVHDAIVLMLGEDDAAVLFQLLATT